MEFKINTKTKEIEITDTINIRDLIIQLELMFPDTWEEYKIKSVVNYSKITEYLPTNTTTRIHDGSGKFLADNNIKGF